jgi:hypothetical protein
MRRLVAALVIVGVAATLAACGGGSTPETTASTTPTTTVSSDVAAVTPGEDSVSPTITISPDQNEQPIPWPLSTGMTPQTILDRFADKQPMIIVYYDPSQSVNRDEMAELSAVMDKYRGLIDLVKFNIANGLPGSTEGTSTEAAKIAELSTVLRVSFTPYIIFVDRFGRITWRFNGFTDRALLEREVLRATQ